MTAAEMVERFQATLRADPELCTIAAVIGPPLAMAEKEGVVAVLDQVAAAWADARGATYHLEDNQ